MDDLHIEDSTEGEEWKTERGEEKKRERDRRRESLCINDLKMI